jgi:hypothetical protein
MQGQPATLLHAAATGRDAYQNDVITYTPEATTAIFVPGAVSEATEGTDETITNGEIYFPDTSISVSSQDRVVIGAITYEVTGDPSQWQSPFTSIKTPVLVRVRLVEGAEAHVALADG